MPQYEAVDNLKKIPVELQGLHERNPVNVPPNAGVQIELPPRARGVGTFWADHKGDSLVPHTRVADRRPRCRGRRVDHPLRRRIAGATLTSPTVAPVHVDRALIEERITRELLERVLPSVERATVPLSLTAGPTA